MSKLWYTKSAKEWEEALPLGNGRMGAMIFGGISQERIQLNEETIWYGARRDRMNPDAFRHLEEIRRNIFSGKIKKAQKLLDMAVAGCPDSMQPYQTLGDIRIEFEGTEESEEYERSLDLENAVSHVRYISGSNVYEREAFLSYPDDCLVMRFSSDRPGKITFTAKLDRGRMADSAGKLSDHGIYLSGTLGNGGTDFVSGLWVFTKGGHVNVIGQTISVEEADEAILYFCADTSWYYQEDEFVQKTLLERMEILKNHISNIVFGAAGYSYEMLKERHRRDYKSLFDRVKFQLEGSSQYDAYPTDLRLRKAAEGYADIGLFKMLFDFGRYLLISSSRSEGLPANLQGIWNQELMPPWDSKYTININTEMNYWLAESGNLSECHLPLFSLLKRMRESGRKMAREMYGCRGFMCHHNTDIHGDCAPQDTWYGSTYWVMGAAWLCTHIWTHYEYTGDRHFLAEYYPILCEAILFFLDYLVEKDGYLVTCPSSSPENEYILPNGESGSVTYGATMDNQILRDLFSQCLLAAEEMKKGNCDAEMRAKKLSEIGIAEESVFLAEVETAMNRLIPNRISREGTIMEWVEEYEERDPGHRHISHLYGLHPSGQISMDKTPDLAQAAKKTLEKRLSNGGGHTGWSRAWIINHYAKLWDGEKAYQNLEQLLAISTYPNMFDRHPPFQIDGNFGAAAAIAEMLVQSSSERIILLPALPKTWKNGSMKGLRIRGNAEIDIEWRDYELIRCVIRAGSDFHNQILYQNMRREVSLKKGETSCVFEK